MAEETLAEVHYETCHHASGPCFPNYPPQQFNDSTSKGVLSLLTTRGLSQLKEKWIGHRQTKKSKRQVSLFVSSKGELVAVAVRNHITILRKDEDYQQPCGTYTSGNVNAFTLGAWSESHGVLGVIDDADNLFFMKSNGEEILRIEQRHLKVSSPIVGLFVSNDVELKGSYLCNFSFLTSDGSLHRIEISQDLSASLSSMCSWSDIKKQFPLNFFCLDYNRECSLLALIGAAATTQTASRDSGFYSLSLWHWRQNSGVELINSMQCEGSYSKQKGFTSLVVSPKIRISPHGKFIGFLDMRGCLNIFKLDGDCSSLSPIACGGNDNGKDVSNTFHAERDFFDDVVDFTWWADHVCTIAKKDGIVSMFDVIDGKKLLDDDPMFSMPVIERTNHLLCKLFVLDIPLLREILNSADQTETSHILDVEQFTEKNNNQFEISRFSWTLVSFSERSVPEMYEVLINNHNYQGALDFAERYKLDKDQVYKFQWLHSNQGKDDVYTLLSKIKDEVFVLGECVERVGHNEDAVKALLTLGLNLTNCYNFSHSETDKSDRVWDFRLSRLQLLQFRDKLETFLGINMGRFSVQEYGKFRVMPINEAAMQLAENGKIGALNLLFKRHPFSLSPFILNVLAAIPETIQVQAYCQLLPGRSPPASTALRVKDWVECEHMVEYMRSLPESNERAVLFRTEPIVNQLFGLSWPSANEILVWYKDRARDIDKFSGQLENSICLLDYGCHKGMYELQPFLYDVSCLRDLVYLEGDEEMHLSISLMEWEGLSDYEKFKAMLKNVKEHNVVERLHSCAVPFMQNKSYSSYSEDGEHQRGNSFLVKWLKEMAASNNIENCSVVIDEWCRDSQNRYFANKVEAVDCALQCIYLCGATDRWNTMASILSKLPYARGLESCLDGLEKRLKLAEGHIEAGRLLALYQVPKPINYFLEAHNDSKGVKQILRLILSKFARHQPGRSDNDWTSMWRDLQYLHEKAFPFLNLEYMLLEFCRGLLKAGRFSLARNYLKGTGAVSLPTEKAEQLVIQTAREYFFSASSLSSSEIWKAKDCLDLFPSSQNVRLEADIIEALTVKLPELGVNILPMQYKQIKDPMEIIKMAIISQAGAYLNVDELIEVAKLLGLSSQEDVSAVQEAIAREAAVAGDLQLASDLCVVLARKGYGLVWDLCAAIARGPAIENMDINHRKQLLSFALCHCDDESISDLLLAWKDLDLEGQSESLMALTGTTPDHPGRGTQPLFAAEFSEDQETLFRSIKDVLSKVAKDLSVANGINWDDVLRENRKIYSFASLQLPWLFELICRSEYGKKHHISVPGRHYVSVRTQAVVTILSWLARNGFSPRDDLISSLAVSVMESPATEEEDLLGCSFLLNLFDAFLGVEVIEKQLKTREDYQEICSIMNVGMIYSLLHNSGAVCEDPLRRRELLLSKFQLKINSDDLDKIDKAQTTFWGDWKLRLEEQKRAADNTKMLEELIPGVDPGRFLSGDLHYMRSAIMSFIESVKSQKKSVLRDVMKLADMYNFNRMEVLLKFLGCVLVSEVWSNEDIAAEILEYKEEILDSAPDVVKFLISFVYPEVNGCNKSRLAYIFSLLSECYMHLEGKELLSSLTLDSVDASTKLSHYYRVLEQECWRVSFIKDLNFKNIADIGIGTLNFKHFNDEVCEHVDNFNVEALAGMVQALLGTCTGAIPEYLISWQDVYRHHVQTEYKNLENRIRECLIKTPERLQSLLSDLEQTYDACRKYIRILEHPAALFFMKKYFTGMFSVNVSRENMHNDQTWIDSLIVLLNFWTKLNDDMLEIAESSEEKLCTLFLKICLKCFLRLVMDGKVTPTQGWGLVYYYANHGFWTSPPVEYFHFCRAMVLSHCDFDSVYTVFSEVISQCSIDQTMSSDPSGDIHCITDVCDLYLNIFKNTLSNFANDSSQQKCLWSLLSSLSRLEGDLETLKRVRTSVWANLVKFTDNLELSSHVRVHVLEVMQFLLGKNVKVSKELEDNVLPWEEWNEWSYMNRDAVFATEPTFDESDKSSRLKSTLVALKTTEISSLILPQLEITADDLLTVDSAISCFLKLCEAANTHSHFDALLAILGEWENLVAVEKNKEASMEASDPSDTGNNWSDDWDEGWESFHDEEPVPKEKTEPSLSIHPLHTCWTEIFKKLTQLSRVDEIVKLFDQSSKIADVVLVDEQDAHSLSHILVNFDCFVALKISLFLPYESVHSLCLNAFEDKLRQQGYPEGTGDRDFLVLVLSSGIISTIISKPSLGSTFSYICYLVGNYSRLSQDSQLSRVSQTSRGDEEDGFDLTFRRILFPCFVSEMVKADQQILAGFLVTKFMNTNASLRLINIAEASLKRYLESHLRVLEKHDSATEVRKPKVLQRTLLNLELKLRNSIQSALSRLPSSS